MPLICVTNDTFNNKGITFLATCIITRTYDSLDFERAVCFNSCQILTAAPFYFLVFTTLLKFFIILIVGIFYLFFGQFCPLK